MRFLCLSSFPANRGVYLELKSNRQTSACAFIRVSVTASGCFLHLWLQGFYEYFVADAIRSLDCSFPSIKLGLLEKGLSLGVSG